MSDLRIQQNYLSYAGGFSDPPMDLWFLAGNTIFPGLHGALRPFGASIDGAEVDSASRRPVEQALIFNFGSQAQYRFSLGGIKADLPNFDGAAYEQFPEMVAAAEAWIVD